MKKQHANHGRDHLPTGMDPIPGIGTGGGDTVLEIKVFADTDLNATGNSWFVFAITEDLDGTVLKSADAYVTTVSSSGAPTIQIRNATTTNDMLSTRITIDVSEFTSYTAATSSVVDTSFDDVTTGQLIAVDVDTAGTGAKGLGVILVFG